MVHWIFARAFWQNCLKFLRYLVHVSTIDRRYNIWPLFLGENSYNHYHCMPGNAVNQRDCGQTLISLAPNSRAHTA